MWQQKQNNQILQIQPKFTGLEFIALVFSIHRDVETNIDDI